MKKRKVSLRTNPGDVGERLDATPERLARAAESGQAAGRGPERQRRIDDPFDVMRIHRALAPHDSRLNDLRWLIGEALRRLHQRAGLDSLRAVAPERIGEGGFGPRSGLPALLNELGQGEIRGARFNLECCMIAGQVEGVRETQGWIEYIHY